MSSRFDVMFYMNAVEIDEEIFLKVFDSTIRDKLVTTVVILR